MCESLRLWFENQKMEESCCSVSCSWEESLSIKTFHISCLTLLVSLWIVDLKQSYFSSWVKRLNIVSVCKYKYNQRRSGQTHSDDECDLSIVVWLTLVRQRIGLLRVHQLNTDNVLSWWITDRPFFWEECLSSCSCNICKSCSHFVWRMLLLKTTSLP